MEKITHFISRQDLEATENIDRFIEFAKKKLTVFGQDLDWDAEIWDMYNHVEYRSIKPPNIRWTVFDSHSKWDNCGLMKEPFISFAKAYIRNSQGIKKTKSYKTTLVALKALEKALCKIYSKPNPKDINVNILNNAQKLLKDRYPNNFSAAASKEIEKISAFLNDNFMLCRPRFIWKTSLKQTDPGRASGKDFTAYRSKKLPTDSCMYAIADIYHNTTDLRDKLCAAIGALLFSSPNRIGEIMTLTKNCIVNNFEGVPNRVGIIWIPEKGGDPFTKPVLPLWKDLVLEVISTIRQLTEKARGMAKWYETHNGKMYLPKKYHYLNNEEIIDTKTVLELLSISKRTLSSIITKYNIKQYHRFHNSSYINFSDLNKFVCSLLPRNFPFRFKKNKLLYSNCILLVPKNFFRSQYNSYSNVMFQSVTFSCLDSLFGGIKTNKSIFDHNDFTEPDGSRMIFKTHSARHWQDTVAEYAQISQTLRAYFAGRKDIRHNQAYSHVPKLVVANKSFQINNQSLIRPNNVDTSIDVFDRPDVMASLLRTQYEHSIHLTDIGFCTMGSESTCKKFSDHILCSDHLYIKGDRRLDLIPKRIELIEHQIQFWKENSEHVAIDVSMKHDEQVLQILKSIMAVIKNPNIPNASFFKLIPGKDYSRMRIAYYRRKNKILGQAGSIPLIKIGTLCIDI